MFTLYKVDEFKHSLFISTIGGMLLSVMSIYTNASTLVSNTNYLKYELPQSIQDQCYEKNNCPEIEIKYLNSNQNWINDIVNARINQIAANIAQTESALITPPITTAQVKKSLDNFTNSQSADLPDDVPWSYQLMVTPEYIGHINRGHVRPSRDEDLELFEINSYVFTGGAHGMPFSEYLIFDPNTKTQIKLADMLEQDKNPYFEALAYDAYKTWVKTIDAEVNIDEYKRNWPFMLDDNITLTDKGIDIRYQHYAIGPYAYGMPVLSIPYNKLNGIIKPRFMVK